MALSKLAADLTAAAEVVNSQQAQIANLQAELAAAQANQIPADVAAPQAAIEAIPAVAAQLAADNPAPA